MKPFSCRHIVIDRCLRCQGIWFDKQELGIFSETLRNLPIETIKVIEPERSQETILSACPRCELMLNEGTYAYNSKVTIQTCPRCSGIWLRYTELIRFIDYVRTGKIIEPLVKELFQKPAPNYYLWVQIIGGIFVLFLLSKLCQLINL